MKMMNVFDEGTGEKVGAVPSFTGAEMAAMVDRAYEIQPRWEKVSLYERSRILYKFCTLVEEHTDEIGMLMAKEIGKPLFQGKVETAYSVDIGRGLIEKGKHIYGEVLPNNTEGYEKSLLFVKREALGVVVAVIPFNFPVELTIQKAVPALLMGNTVLVKAATAAPMAVKRLVELLHEAGVPEDCVQFITGDREDCTKYLLQNPKVACLGLTGSTEAGTEVIKCSADTIKKVILELGGNDALIIREDVANDPKYMAIAVNAVASGRVFENNGQVCASPKRILIHRKAKETFIKAMIAYIGCLKHGHATSADTDISRLVSVKAAEKVEAQIKHTVAQGAKVVYGGKRDGATFEPTILDGVTADMDIAKDMEVFGPIVNLITFDTDDEALAIANQSKYGLSSAVITKDIIKGLYIAENIEAAACHINATSACRHNEQPFGGCKGSGIGNEGALTSCEEFTRLKTYHIAGACTSEPPFEERENGLVEYAAKFDAISNKVMSVIQAEMNK